MVDTVSLKAFLICRSGPSSYAVARQSLLSMPDWRQILIYRTCACLLAALVPRFWASALQLSF